VARTCPLSCVPVQGLADNCGFMEYQGPQKSAASRVGASTVARKIAKENVMPETRWEKQLNTSVSQLGKHRA